MVDSWDGDGEKFLIKIRLICFGKLFAGRIGI